LECWQFNEVCQFSALYLANLGVAVVSDRHFADSRIDHPHRLFLIHSGLSPAPLKSIIEAYLKSNRFTLSQQIMEIVEHVDVAVPLMVEKQISNAAQQYDENCKRTKFK